VSVSLLFLLSSTALPLLLFMLLCFLVFVVIANLVRANVCDKSVYHNMGASCNHFLAFSHGKLVRRQRRIPASAV
jgi:hypothetical protein